MKRTVLLLIFILNLNHTFAAKFPNLSNTLLKSNKIVEAAPFEKTMPAFEYLPRESVSKIPKERYNRILELHKKEFTNRSYNITYISQGLKVKGIIIFPEKFDPHKKWPVVVYNRGGNREFGRIIATYRLGHDYGQGKNIVIASQYRGVAGGEGKEEFGGADVDDILNLMKVINKFDFIDTHNTFMVGVSRGGMMTYLALKKGAKVNAAVSWAGVTNLFLSTINRPKMEQYVYNQLIPNIFKNREKVLKERSAIFWAEKITTPILMLHGDKDERVTHAHALNLEKKFIELDYEYKLIIYEGEGHSLSYVRKEAIAEINNWFDKYRKQ